MNVGDNFVVESLQNTTTGSSKNSGINVSTNISKNINPVAGANVGKGRKQGNWTQNQTSITAQNGGTIKVGNETNLVGSVINSENSEIKLETKKLTTTDIVDTQKETNGQIGLSGITKGKVPQTTVEYNEKDKNQISKTTLSNVNVVEDGKVLNLAERQINQDLEKSQEITKDREKSFDAPLHIDLLDEETRKQVIRDFKRTIQLPVKIVDGIIYSNTIETHKKTGKVAEKELGKSIRASVRDLNIETLFKTKELRNEYEKQLTDTMDNGQLTDESLKVASKVILGVLAQNGIENPSIVFSIDEKLVKSVAKTDTNHFIINLNNIDITNYDNLIDLMQYEGQRFSYSDKETDDVTANQGTDLDKYLGKTNISSDSELLRRENEFVANTDLSGYWDNLVIVHGGNKANSKSVDGPLIAFKENITKESLDFKYNEVIQIYTSEGVKLLSKYKHNKGEPVKIWGHSLGADSILEAYAVGYKESGKYEKGRTKLKPQKADELNVIMPRISFIQKYITKASENSKIINLFVMRGDNVWWAPYYGDRSYETLIKKINSGKIKIPSNVRIIPLDKVKGKGTFNNHGSALKYNDKMFKQIEKEYMKVRGKNEK